MKKKPIIVSQTKTFSKANKITYNQNNLITLCFADDKSNKYYDPTIFSIRFTTKHLKADALGVKYFKRSILRR